MRPIALVLTAAVLGLAAPALAAPKAPKPIVCGVRTGTGDDPPSAKRAQALAEAAPAEPAAEAAPDLAEAEAGGFPKDQRKLYLVLLDDKATCSETGDGRCKWGVVKPVAYVPSNGTDRITVPKGFPTDLTSIPRFAWTLLPPDGPWLKAAVIHDFLYRTCGRGVWLNQPNGLTRHCAPNVDCYRREEADWILRDAMKDRGVGVVKRNIIWAAVRLGGGGGWGH
jgi:hypothetical protein